MHAQAAEEGHEDSVTSLRIAALNVSALAPLVASVNRIAQDNGLQPVSWTMVDTATAEATILKDLMTERRFHAYVLTGQQAGDMVNMGVPQDLSSLVAEDVPLNWRSFLHIYRESIATFGGNVISLPVSGLMMLLYYRTDLFGAAGMQPPRTWDEAIAAAAHFNGTDLNGDGAADDFGLCIWQPLECPSTGMPVAAILASLAQAQGHNGGLYIHPATGRSVIDTVAWPRALELAAKLAAYAAPAAPRRQNGTSDCGYMPLFGKGRCAMAIGGPSQFKTDSAAPAASSSSSSPPSSAAANGTFATGGSAAVQAATGAGSFSVRGRIGAAVLPGSQWVLDWPSNTMVPCTADRCPYALSYSDMSGTTGGEYVNVAPYASAIGFTAFFNNRFSFSERLATYYVLSQAIRLDTSWDLVASPCHSGGPTRIEHLEPANRQRWRRYGYNDSDLECFLAATMASLESENIATDLRSAGASNFTRITHIAGAMLGSGKARAPVPAVLNATLSAYAAILSSCNVDLLLESYKLSIMHTRVVAASEELEAGDGGRNGQRTVLREALGSALPGAAVLLVMVAGLVWGARQHRLWKLRRFGRIVPPGPGPDTTLCVTDIQDSTLLWERLDEAVMDTALRLHNACLRRCATAYGGYESATEGDSFILSFMTPHAALLFCLSAQEELLQVEWPERLLQEESCVPVWVWDPAVTAETTMTSHAGSRDALLGRKAMRLLQRLTSPSSEARRGAAAVTTAHIQQPSPLRSMRSCTRGPVSAPPLGVRDGGPEPWSGPRTPGLTATVQLEPMPSGPSLLRTMSGSEVDSSDPEVLRGATSTSLLATTGEQTQQEQVQRERSILGVRNGTGTNVDAGGGGSSSSGATGAAARASPWGMLSRSFHVRHQQQARPNTSSNTTAASTSCAVKAAMPVLPTTTATTMAKCAADLRPGSEPCVYTLGLRPAEPATPAAVTAVARIPSFSKTLPAAAPKLPCWSSRAGSGPPPSEASLHKHAAGRSAPASARAGGPTASSSNETTPVQAFSFVEELLRALAVSSTGGIAGVTVEGNGGSRDIYGTTNAGSVSTVAAAKWSDIRGAHVPNLMRQEPNSIWQLMGHHNGTPLRFALGNTGAVVVPAAAATGVPAAGLSAGEGAPAEDNSRPSPSMVHPAVAAAAMGTEAPPTCPSTCGGSGGGVFPAPYLPLFSNSTDLASTSRAPTFSPGPGGGRGERPRILDADLDQHVMQYSNTDLEQKFLGPAETPAPAAPEDRQQVELSQPRGHLVFRGLRVRMGCSSGVDQAVEVSYNSRMARMIYTGRPMALARAVGGAAAGGMVLLSEASHALITKPTLEHHDRDPPRSILASKTAPPQCVNLSRMDCGLGKQGSRKDVNKKQATKRKGGSGVMAATSSGSRQAVFWYGGCVRLDELLPTMEVYQAATPVQALRWALLPPPTTRLKLDPLSGGVQAGLVGNLVIAVVAVSAAPSLLSINGGQGQGDLWRETAETIWLEAARLCSTGGGFLATRRSALIGVEPEVLPQKTGSSRGGGRSHGLQLLVTAAFSDATAAVVWASELITTCLVAHWPAQLLESELGEALWADVPALPPSAPQLMTAAAAAAGTPPLQLKLHDGISLLPTFKPAPAPPAGDGGIGPADLPASSTMETHAVGAQPVSFSGGSIRSSGRSTPTGRGPRSISSLIPGRMSRGDGADTQVPPSSAQVVVGVSGGYPKQRRTASGLYLRHRHHQSSHHQQQHRLAAAPTPFAQWLGMQQCVEPAEAVPPWANLRMSRLRLVSTPSECQPGPSSSIPGLLVRSIAPAQLSAKCCNNSGACSSGGGYGCSMAGTEATEVHLQAQERSPQYDQQQQQLMQLQQLTATHPNLQLKQQAVEWTPAALAIPCVLSSLPEIQPAGLAGRPHMRLVSSAHSKEAQEDMEEVDGPDDTAEIGGPGDLPQQRPAAPGSDELGEEAEEDDVLVVDEECITLSDLCWTVEASVPTSIRAAAARRVHAHVDGAGADSVGSGGAASSGGGGGDVDGGARNRVTTAVSAVMPADAALFGTAVVEADSSPFLGSYPQRGMHQHRQLPQRLSLQQGPKQQLLQPPPAVVTSLLRGAAELDVAASEPGVGFPTTMSGPCCHTTGGASVGRGTATVDDGSRSDVLHTGTLPGAAEALAVAVELAAQHQAAASSRGGTLERSSPIAALPQQLLQSLVCRGPRLRAGVELGNASLEVNGVTGAPRYVGPVAASAIALALGSPVSRVHVSPAVAAALHQRGVAEALAVTTQPNAATTATPQTVVTEAAPATVAGTTVAEVQGRGISGGGCHSGCGPLSSSLTGGTCVSKGPASQSACGEVSSNGGSDRIGPACGALTPTAPQQPALQLLPPPPPPQQQQHAGTATTMVSAAATTATAAWVPPASLIARVVVRAHGKDAPASDSQSHSHGIGGGRRFIFTPSARH